MKKTYIQPSIEAVKLQATTILAGSETIPTSQFGTGSGKAGSDITINSKRGDWGEVEFED